MNVTDWLILAYFVALIAGMLTFAGRGSIWWKPLLILLVLSIGGMFLYLPGHYGPSERLKPGLDLAGGTKLIYDVQIPEDTNQSPDQIIDDTISILKERVDPRGTKNLVWREVAGNRIEIQMPLATASTLDKREAYREARDQLLATNIAETEITAALRMADEQRADRLKQLAGEDQKLLNQLQQLAQQYDHLNRVSEPYRNISELYREAQNKLGDSEADFSLPDRYEEARQALTDYREAQQQVQQLETQVAATQPAGDDGAATQPAVDQTQLEAARKHASNLRQQVITALRQRMLEATQAYRKARNAYESSLNATLQRNIPAAELERVLNLPAEPQAGEDQSPRGQAIELLKRQHPQRGEQIATVVDRYNAYDQVRGRFDDPEDLIALLEGAGVIEFRIAPRPDTQGVSVQTYRDMLQQKGPRSGRDEPWRWFKIEDPANFVNGEDALERLQQTQNQAEDAEARRQAVARFFEQRGYVAALYGGEYYLLLGNTTQTAMTEDQDWALESAMATRDRNQQRAIAFNLDPEGGQLMGQLTGPHVGQPMAILLDDQVISAPNLQSQINGRGQITGGFTQKEQSYLLRTLKAGSLQGQLKGPLSIQTTGPTLGQDNLQAGFKASVLALVLVALIALGYYFFAGAVADFALAANMILILGTMSMLNATFTLPGIAGLVLTIGMAIDANVLVFERIREELERKMPTAQAVRIGYQKALSTVLDANITTLITCFVLYNVATAEVKGFALVLGIGIVATLFTALFCTRVLLELWITYGRSHRLSMLPTVVPAVRNALSPTVDWIGKRYVAFALSALLIVGGVAMIATRGKNMLDIEFRAGTQVTFALKEGQTLSIGAVRDRLTLYGNVAQAIQQGQPRSAMESDAERSAYDKLKPIIEDANQTDQPGNGNTQTAGPSPSEAADAAGQSKPNVDFSLIKEASVVTLGRSEQGEAASFQISTLITSDQAVSSIIKAAFEEQLDESKARPISFRGDELADISAVAQNDMLYPIDRTNDQGQATLGLNINRTGYPRDITSMLGGAAFVLEDLQPAVSIDDVQQRIDRMGMRREYARLDYREFEVIGLDPAAEASGEEGQTRYRSVVVIVSNQNVNYAENPEALTKDNGLAATSWPWIKDAMKRDATLGSISNFSGQISATMQQQAIVAMGLALLAVVVYIWFRFGSLRYGLAAIVALVHDVTITLGLVAIAGFVYDSAIGAALMLQPFKIDLAMVAALLTIIGYSLNDTIVVFDRIRENRGRLAHATPAIINDSINQTISRTALTSGSTLVAVGVLYIFGGSGVHGFAFAMILGVLAGTYSSIAVAAPSLLVGTGGWGQSAEAKQPATAGEARQPETAAAASKA